MNLEIHVLIISKKQEDRKTYRKMARQRDEHVEDVILGRRSRRCSSASRRQKGTAQVTN